MSCEINKIQSYTCNYELKNELEKRNFRYIHSDLLYYGSIGIDLKNRTFYPLAVSIYPKFSDEKILSIIEELDNRS